MKRIVIGMSGASGSVLGIEVLKAFGKLDDWETHLVVTEGAEITLGYETGLSVSELTALADYAYDRNDIAASISSGTFRTEGMIIVPCSMKTAAGIACGYSDNLLLRAADVTLKEKRPLILAAREAPLSTIHLRNLLTLSEFGATIIPPVVPFYTAPQSVEDIVRQITGRILGCLGIEDPMMKHWEKE